MLMAIEPNRPRTNPSAMDHNGSSTVSRSSSVKTGWLGAAVGARVDAMAAGPGGHRAASADARPTVRAASAARRGRWLPGGAGLQAGLPGAAQATVVASRRGQAWRSLALRSRGCELPAFRTLGPPVGLLGLTLAKPPHAPARPRGESSGRAAGAVGTGRAVPGGASPHTRAGAPRWPVVNWWRRKLGAGTTGSG